MATEGEPQTNGNGYDQFIQDQEKGEGH